MKSILAWTLAAGQSIGFYQVLDGVVVARKPIAIGGEEHELVAYGWPDAGALAGPGQEPVGPA